MTKKIITDYEIQKLYNNLETIDYIQRQIDYEAEQEREYLDYLEYQNGLTINYHKWWFD